MRVIQKIGDSKFELIESNSGSQMVGWIGGTTVHQQECIDSIYCNGEVQLQHTVKSKQGITTLEPSADPCGIPYMFWFQINHTH